MDRKTEQQLIRLLAGELAPEDARELRRRLEKEEELRQVFASLQERWQALEPPPVQPVHSSFTSCVVHQATTGPSIEAAGLGRAAPVWARAAAAVALGVGMVVGSLLVSPSKAEEWADWNAVELTQAEVYWETLDDVAADLGQENQP